MSPPPFTTLLLRGTALLLAVVTLLTLHSGAGIFAKEKIVYLAGSGALGVATLLYFGQLVIIAPIVAVWKLWRRRPVWMRVATVLFGCGTAYFVALGIASSRAGMYWGLALYYLFGNIAGLCVGICFIAVTWATRRHSLGGVKIGPKD
jgi:hypothetical protein